MPLMMGCWQLDNFYTPLENMDRLMTDCYFYYYSVCKNGKHCPYRHEPAALGHEVMCNRWLEGRCLNVKCKNRHMRIGKRDQIPCFWENTPTGCTKRHCVFRHNNKQQQANQDGAIPSQPIANTLEQDLMQHQQQHLQHDISASSSGVHSMISVGDASHLDLSGDRIE